MPLKNTADSYWVKPSVCELEAYVPGAQIEESGWVKLNTNENPYPSSPKVWEAISGEKDRLHLYPNPLARKLRDKVAECYSLPRECVIAGNGSDDILNLLMRTFSDAQHPAGAMEPSYSLYPVLAGANGSHWIDIPFDEPFQLPVEAILNSGCNLFYLTCPHAPSGVCYPLDIIKDLAKKFTGILVVDEAYADFAGGSALTLVEKYPNLFVTRTFSKAWGLAGLRVGFGAGAPELIQLLDTVRDSYNLDRLAQAAALAALNDFEYYQALIQKICYTRDFYRLEFEKMKWFVYPSQANFLFVEPRDAAGRSGPDVANSLFQHLLANKILVRYFPKHALTRNFIRISIGDENQMMSLWDQIIQWLNKE